MNRGKLKNYAPLARREFIQAVTDRAAFFGLTKDKIDPITVQGDVAIIEGRPFPRAVAEKRRRLEERIRRQGFEQVMEAVAYTWFNRFVAIRYMELHGYLDHGYRVLSHPDAAKSAPEIVEHAEHVELRGLDKRKVIDLKLDGSKEAELYRMLLIAQCNALHKAMPFLFERIDDETELLLPDNLLHSDSIIRKLVNEIDEADWQQVEIIGWLYQFYISEKKAEVIGKVVRSEDIPAATQLFTPNWIVKYLVQNSLGRQWLATYPNSPLKKKWEYYIEPAEQTPEVLAQLAEITPTSLNPEELTIMDPACGSGHILVEAYDLLKDIYLERGYRLRDIPRLILTRNVYGLEIDDRAAQLAAFALMMKARADDRRVFDGDVQPNVVAIQESNGLNVNAIVQAFTEKRVTDESFPTPGEFGFMVAERAPLFAQATTAVPAAADEKIAADLKALLALFENAKTYGSLITIPPELAKRLPALAQAVEAARADANLAVQHAARIASGFVMTALLLAKQYDAVVANPPYMTSDYMPRLLKDFVEAAHDVKRTDLYAVFLARGLTFTSQRRVLSMITRDSWLFLPTFEGLRLSVLGHRSLLSLAHLGPQAFDTIGGHVVQTVMFSLLPDRISSYRSTFYRLVDGDHTDKQTGLLARNCQHVLSQSEFERIPGSPMAYWVSDATRAAFAANHPISKMADIREGIHTGNNDRFMRFWWEVDAGKFSDSEDSIESIDRHQKKWIPYNKGGVIRKWYGNNEYVIAFDRAVRDEMKQCKGHVRPSQHLYFREGATWSDVGSGFFCVRYYPSGFLFDGKGMAVVSPRIWYLLGLMNSVVFQHLAEIVMPTLNYKSGTVKKLPYVEPSDDNIVELNARRAVVIVKRDWDAQERSWQFMAHPFVGTSRTDDLVTSLASIQSAMRQAHEELLRIEEANNRYFLDRFGLAMELPTVPGAEQLTIDAGSSDVLVRRLMSYAVGCAMGRYSLDKPGLIYANSGNEGFDPSQYKTFPADPDGIVPTTEIDWFPDSAAHRFEEFVGVAWPGRPSPQPSPERGEGALLEENLKFVADSLGAKNGESPRETIRRYFADGFFKDHLKTYKRRPIYWLFTSGRLGAFQCLVYLHRYNEGTLARMRTEYVIPLQGKIKSRIEQLEGDKPKATSAAHRRRVEKEQDTLRKHQAELLKFDEKLRHYADLRIKLDLDDGVKVNYGKFGDLLACVTQVCGKAEDDE